MNNLENNTNYNNKTFEDIKHIDENGVEFWYARELMSVLQYSNWQNFERIVDKAKVSCENSDITVFGGWVKNANGKSFYVKGNGSDEPLIDTGTMRNSIRYEVENV